MVAGSSPGTSLMHNVSNFAGMQAFASTMRTFQSVGYDTPSKVVDNWLRTDSVDVRIGLTQVIAKVLGVGEKEVKEVCDLANSVRDDVLSRNKG